MKFGVVIFPGSNCDQDMIFAIGAVFDQEAEILWHKNESIGNYSNEDWIMLPGGFSYGDYLRSGAIARFSPIMKSVIDFAKTGGNILGICNGFQILCEAGLLPGTLLQNEGQKFICDNVYLKSAMNNSKINAGLDKGRVLKIPIAHADGNYFADDETLTDIKKNDQILFQYCDGEGNVGDSYNPNGSVYNIAGICNANRNVFGMMPHPERAVDPRLGNEDGRYIFESILSKVNVNVQA